MRDPQGEGLRWLRQAEADLEAARLLRERLAALACFHAQQAAEKALKAVLYAAGERVVLGHSLSALGEAVSQQSPGYEPLREAVAKLDRFYIPTRYPNALPQGADPASAFDPADAQAAIDSAQKALDHARGYLTGSS